MASLASGHSYAARLVPIGLVAALALLGCQRKPEYNGIGGWVLGRTTMAEFGGVCRPDGKLSYCQASPLVASHHVDLGGQQAAVDAYFDGDEPMSKLVEVILTVNGCRVSTLRAWLEHTFQEPTEVIGEVALWKGRYAVIAARLPTRSVRCEINVVDVADQARIRALVAPAAP